MLLCRQSLGKVAAAAAGVKKVFLYYDTNFSFAPATVG